MRPIIKFLAFSSVILVTMVATAGQQADPRAEVLSWRYHQHPDFFRIVLDLEKIREYYSAELTSPERFYLDIFQAKLKPGLHGTSVQINSPSVKALRLAQKNPSTVRLTLELVPGAKKGERIFYLKEPTRLVVDIYSTKPAAISGGDEISSEKPPQPPVPSSSGYSLVRQLGLGVKRIVLDPGHGGKDPGCLSPSGLKEKDVALDLAKRLKTILETKGNFEVFLTRETDINLPLEKRTAFANEKGADLFISIHLNASPRKNRTGVETFYLNFSPDPAVNELAARENASSTKNIRDMKLIVDKIIKNSKYQESRDLAEKIHRNLLQHLTKNYGPRQDLGVKGGPFWVLIGSEMPAILVEASHLSNAKEEAALKTDSYREAVATGLFHGIMEYVKSLGKG
ncbi:MAG: N-acetylmuramoyl-L-alanine amidase [Acidobacteriota bacterium]|nr:N-acetylmuramoyl-L-alanine amidase [Acidobacteriota bacterium]MDW3228422.1 N-acetylmuramoyl-L-alanine amidase [Acidobacteriota bacterium]MDY0231300.1 N-acetylmuramoyl-L-alanine amidase [Candidatus Saccharicenans sp.]